VGFVGCLANPWFLPCVFVWVPVQVVFGCSLSGSRV
jgi:hypothetical protein